MKYQEIRESIVTGDLFFTASNSLFSRLIRLVTQSKVSHVGVFVRLGGRIFIVEALEGNGVIMSLASERIKKVSCWWARTSRGKNNTREIEDHLLMSLGTEYDMVGAILSLIRDTKSAEKFCSELAQHALGIGLEFQKRGTTPADLVNLCEQIEQLTYNEFNLSTN